MTYHLPAWRAARRGTPRTGRPASSSASASTISSSSVASTAASASSTESMSRASSTIGVGLGVDRGVERVEQRSRSASTSSSSVVDDVDRAVLGGVDRVAPPARGCCPPGPRRPRRTALLPSRGRCRGALVHSCFFRLCCQVRRSVGRIAWLRRERPVAEDPGHSAAEHPVEAVHERHHDDDEDQHDARVAEQLLAGRGDDLPQSAKTWRMNRAMRANGPRFSARSRLAFATTSSLGSSTTFRATLSPPFGCFDPSTDVGGLAGRTGLEPATCGFGDRCSTN